MSFDVAAIRALNEFIMFGPEHRTFGDDVLNIFKQSGFDQDFWRYLQENCASELSRNVQWFNMVSFKSYYFPFADDPDCYKQHLSFLHSALLCSAYGLFQKEGESIEGEPTVECVTGKYPVFKISDGNEHCFLRTNCLYDNILKDGFTSFDVLIRLSDEKGPFYSLSILGMEKQWRLLKRDDIKTLFQKAQKEAKKHRIDVIQQYYYKQFGAGSAKNTSPISSASPMSTSSVASMKAVETPDSLSLTTSSPIAAITSVETPDPLILSTSSSGPSSSGLSGNVSSESHSSPQVQPMQSHEVSDSSILAPNNSASSTALEPSGLPESASSETHSPQVLSSPSHEVADTSGVAPKTSCFQNSHNSSPEQPSSSFESSSVLVTALSINKTGDDIKNPQLSAPKNSQKSSIKIRKVKTAERQALGNFHNYLKKLKSREINQHDNVQILTHLNKLHSLNLKSEDKQIFDEYINDLLSHFLSSPLELKKINFCKSLLIKLNELDLILTEAYKTDAIRILNAYLSFHLHTLPSNETAANMSTLVHSICSFSATLVPSDWEVCEESINCILAGCNPTRIASVKKILEDHESRLQVTQGGREFISHCVQRMCIIFNSLDTRSFDTCSQAIHLLSWALDSSISNNERFWKSGMKEDVIQTLVLLTRSCSGTAQSEKVCALLELITHEQRLAHVGREQILCLVQAIANNRNDKIKAVGLHIAEQFKVQTKSELFSPASDAEIEGIIRELLRTGNNDCYAIAFKILQAHHNKIGKKLIGRPTLDLLKILYELANEPDTPTNLKEQYKELIKLHVYELNRDYISFEKQDMVIYTTVLFFSELNTYISAGIIILLNYSQFFSLKELQTILQILVKLPLNKLTDKTLQCLPSFFELIEERIQEETPAQQIRLDVERDYFSLLDKILIRIKQHIHFQATRRLLICGLTKLSFLKSEDFDSKFENRIKLFAKKCISSRMYYDIGCVKKESMASMSPNLSSVLNNSMVPVLQTMHDNINTLVEAHDHMDFNFILGLTSLIQVLLPAYRDVCREEGQAVVIGLMNLFLEWHPTEWYRGSVVVDEAVIIGIFPDDLSPVIRTNLVDVTVDTLQKISSPQPRILPHVFNCVYRLNRYHDKENQVHEGLVANHLLFAGDKFIRALSIIPNDVAAQLFSQRLLGELLKERPERLTTVVTWLQSARNSILLSRCMMKFLQKEYEARAEKSLNFPKFLQQFIIQSFKAAEDQVKWAEPFITKITEGEDSFGLRRSLELDDATLKPLLATAFTTLLEDLYTDGIFDLDIHRKAIKSTCLIMLDVLDCDISMMEISEKSELEKVVFFVDKLKDSLQKELTELEITEFEPRIQTCRSKLLSYFSSK